MRLGVSLAVTFSTATGYIIAKSSFDINILYVCIGVFLLAGGASALNQYQERITDALMSRTKNRPIPSGKISASTGLIIAVILCLLGSFVLFIKLGITPFLLGFLNLLWYNGFYTYLKKKTAFAVVPGSLTGVTPLLIGWSATGESLLNFNIIFIWFFIYMWQVPHFWLLQIHYTDDYKKASLGSLYQFFSSEQVKRIVFVWIISTSLTSLLLPYFGIIQSKPLIWAVIAINAGLIITFYRIIFNSLGLFNYKKAFILINAFMIIVMLILIVESLFYKLFLFIR
ncbi:MAG: hypothetical protein A2041_06225 [Bacteroidetes bacterium GWA2_31_9b]|nr:MAG: hypothetical protein A2041_06225 [Bacteroidetes bacterium GWA2_31_9b]